ncbi:hypothetical protein HRI_003654700 [Hibiscus trionum]|uniref:Uncharacterized protein n=1 Tax=Hibiscus trionum TaxID=183268 RepID=A0A9W7INK9_HIBTR|nr:hypothetical protein HRI_003654700 [Hibiscus trionum]
MGGNESKNQRRDDGDDGPEKAAAAAAAAAALVVGGLVALGVSVLASASGASTSKKTMKAPGRNDRIFRDDFERDPATYFRDLRKK